MSSLVHFFLAVVIMICVFHSPGVKHGLDQLVTRLWMNGGLGLPMDKLLGTYFFCFPFIKPCETVFNELYNKTIENNYILICSGNPFLVDTWYRVI